MICHNLIPIKTGVWGRWGQKGLSRPSADSIAVIRKKNEYK
jgi:hypothetical protein